MATEIHLSFGAPVQLFGDNHAPLTLAAQRPFTAQGRHALLCPN
ncbi:MAG: hypothetical protein AB9869_25275 [Verrucomicrobiia bacterium]